MTACFPHHKEARCPSPQEHCTTQTVFLFQLLPQRDVTFNRKPRHSIPQRGVTPLTATPGHYCPTHNRKPLPPLIILCCIFTWCNMNHKELSLRSRFKSKITVTLYHNGGDTCWSAPLLYTADPPTLFACFFGIFGKIQKLCILD